STEFLILKFDKCKNWGLIAEACVDVLGDTIYKGAGNLNIKKLKNLKGKVIVLFGKDGYRDIPNEYKARGGILPFKNLYDGGVYDEDYNGLQYYGKGGTKVTNTIDKTEENYKKQKELMRKGAKKDVSVMGMMYWTTTGVFESIEKRNRKMWTGR